MKRWEYMEVRGAQSWQLNDLGVDGWEVVAGNYAADAPSRADIGWTCLLKREIVS